jgi:DNA-binding NarL/FixJ family response regulator
MGRVDATVLLADDHPPTRLGTRLSLEAAGFTISAEVGTAQAAVEAATRERPDVALLDIRMPGNGLTAAAEIAEAAPDTAIVMLTVSRDDDDLLTALAAGAVGYLLKDIDPARLPKALESVLAGETALPQSLVSRMARRQRQSRDRSTRALLRKEGIELSDSEWEVLELLDEGHAPAEIARRLELDERTVQRHLSALAGTLGARSASPDLRLLPPND